MDAHDIEPIYEFGHGLSYTTFEYSELRVQKLTPAGEYEPTTGETEPAPTFGNFSTDLADYLFPEGDASSPRRIAQYIYPWLNVSNPEKASADPHYGGKAEDFLPPNAGASGPQQRPAAGPGAGQQPGGNARLFEPLYEVSARVTNTGSLPGDEVAQLYVSLGGPDEPPKVLRGFDRLPSIAPGQTVVFSATLTRRDLSNWDVAAQDWTVTDHAKTVYVGSSSRKLPLSAQLE